MPDKLFSAGAVFLSYASEDADAAARICEALRAAGIEVWFDRNELRGGDAWDSQIKKQIHDCALFVPLISAHTNARIEGYFRGEWNLATRRLVNRAHDAAFLMPVVVDETREADARVPEEFLRAQWTWLPSGETPPAFAQRVRQLLGQDFAPVPSAKATAPGVVDPSTHSPGPLWRRSTPLTRRFGLAIIVALLVLGGGAVWYIESTSDPPAAKPVPAPAPAITAAAPNEKSIAVLPFADMSASKDQEYFADGLSEELLNLLAKLPELRVIGRTSSFQFKARNEDLRAIGEKLNVAHILDGSVRKSGEKLRITAQLIRVADGSHIWSQTYDRKLADVFDVQDQIAGAVVAELKTRLVGAAPKAETTDPKAYALYLQGREIGRQNTDVSYERSNGLYRQVLALDPGYLAAWEGLAFNYINQAFFAVAPVEESMRLARDATNKALALAPARAPTLHSLASIAAYYDLDFSAAAKHLEDALALEPNNPDVLLEAGALMRRLLRLERAIMIGRYQVGLDPINPLGYEVLGSSYSYVGRHDDALAAWRTMLSLSPGYAGGHEVVGEGLLAKGESKAALAEMQQEILPGNRLVGLSMAYHALGRKRESDEVLAEAMRNHSKQIPFMIAYGHAYRGDADRAFEWLEQAAEYHDPFLVAVAGHPMLRNIRSDPRWLPFLRRLRMDPEQFAAIKFDVKLPK